MESLRGHFLVGSPHLNDPNFFRSVVLMVQHDAEGALGLILNRPTHSKIADIWEDICNQPSQCQRPIYVGGPVEGPLMAIHSQLAYSELQITTGVHFSSQKHNLEKIVASDPKPFLIFSGYSGWGAGQLEMELTENVWLIGEPDTALVFDPSLDTKWSRALTRIGVSPDKLQVTGGRA